MAVTETSPPGPPNRWGDGLVAELRWVHDMIRRDLLAHLRYEEESISDTLRILAARTDGPGW